MSETPSEYTAQEAEAEAEGVRPGHYDSPDNNAWTRANYVLPPEPGDPAVAGEAEVVQPLSEDELAEMQRWVIGLTFVQGGMADRVERLIATLDAARAEQERKEAEAAVLREALQSYAGLDNVSFGGVKVDIANRTVTSSSPHYDAGPAVRALNNTTAGADLLERVRQLEELVREAKPEIQSEWTGTGGPIGWARDWLERAEATLAEYHQGTGAAGEEGI